MKTKMKNYENIKKKSIKKCFNRNPNRNLGHLGRLNNLHLGHYHN
jgi:hypothetical protein